MVVHGYRKTAKLIKLNTLHLYLLFYVNYISKKYKLFF